MSGVHSNYGMENLTILPPLPDEDNQVELQDLMQGDLSTYVPFTLGVTASSGVTDFNKASHIALQVPKRHPDYSRCTNLTEAAIKEDEELEARLVRNLEEDIVSGTELGLRLRDLVAVTQVAKDMRAEQSKVLDDMFEHMGKQKDRIDEILNSRKELARKITSAIAQRSPPAPEA